jgi:hypothetical protein
MTQVLAQVNEIKRKEKAKKVAEEEQKQRRTCYQSPPIQDEFEIQEAEFEKAFPIKAQQLAYFEQFKKQTGSRHSHQLLKSTAIIHWAKNKLQLNAGSTLHG